MVVRMPDGPVLVDHDHGPLGAHTPVSAVELGNRPIYVREQRHVESVLLDEALMRRHVLRRNADDRRAQRSELVRPIPIRAKLCFTEGRVVVTVGLNRPLLLQAAAIARRTRRRAQARAGFVQDRPHRTSGREETALDEGRVDNAPTHVAPVLGFTLADDQDISEQAQPAERPPKAN